MNKIVLFAGLISGWLTPIYTGEMPLNLLDNVGTIYLSYDRGHGQFLIRNFTTGAFTNLMTFNFVADNTYKNIEVTTLPAYEDFIINFAINITINNDYKFVVTNYIEYDTIDNLGYRNALLMYIPYEFDYSYTPEVDRYPNEYGIFYIRFDDYSDTINDIKLSVDILEAGSIPNYDSGYDAGYDAGYDVGFEEGQEHSLVTTSFVDFIVNAVGGFMDFELFPNFTLGGLIGSMVAVLVAVILLRVFAGG